MLVPALAIVLLAHTPPPWTAPDIARPAPEQPEASSLSAVRRMVRAYREGIVAQSAKITTVTSAGKERTSMAAVRTSPGEPASVGLRYGRALHVWASGDRLIALTPRNKSIAFVAPLGGPVDAGRLSAVLRDLTLPQVGLALGPDPLTDGPAGAVLRLTPVGPVTIDPEVRSISAEWVVTGQTEIGPVEVRIDRSSGLLRRLTGLVASSGGPVRIDMIFRPAEPEEPKWVLDPAERRVVGSLSDLRPADAEVAVGAPLPNLGLMTPGLAAHSWRDAVEQVRADPTQAGTGPILTGLVLYRRSVPEAGDAALTGAGVLRASKKSLDQRRVAGRAGVPRLVILPVAVMELAEFEPGLPRLIEEEWKQLGEVAAWTSSGQGLIERFAPGSSAVVVLADEDQIVRGIVPLEAGQGDMDAVLSELRGLIDEVTPAEDR
jgi:hypothetical protein